MSNNSLIIGNESGGSSGVSNAVMEHVPVRPSDGECVQRDPDGLANGTNMQGTPSSNTVPSNDNKKHFKALLFGIGLKWPPLTRQPEDKLSSNMAG